MRLPDWEERFTAFVEANKARPFSWEDQWDCALMATALAAELTGIDKAAAFRGAYTTREGSAKALRELGKGTLLKTMNDLFEPKPVASAMRGDLVMRGTAIGFCYGHVAVFVGENNLGTVGFVTMPMAECVRAWHV